MVNYKCPRCGYEINIKTKYVNHLSRKTLCNNKLSDNNLQSEYIKYKIIKSNNKSKMNPKKSKMNPKKSKMNPKKTNKEYICNFCEKIYSNNSNLYKHHKICKEKKKDDECKNDMIELVQKLNDQLQEQNKQLEKRDKQIDEQNKQINQLIKKTGINIGTQNIQNIQNIQNNIKILAYKNTDLSHLTDKDYLFCLNRSNMCIPNLIKRIHFDPRKPENNNVYISNIKNKYIMIYDGDKWNLSNQNETIDDLIDTNEVVLEQKLEEWIENGKDYPEIMIKFNRYLEKKEKDDVINKIKNEIKLLLYNNRKVINDQIDI